jgi:hypothetical protein
MSINNSFQSRKQTRYVRWFSLVLSIILLGLFLGACRFTSSVEANASDTPGPSETDSGSEFPPGFPTPDPEQFQDCLDQGGQWEVLGFSGPGCNLPTEDGGKACSDWADCESLCLADDDTLYNEDASGFLQPDHEVIEQRNAEDDQLSGVCSAWQNNFGCNVILENGKYVVICID